MRIVLQVVEFVLYMLALFGFVFGVVIIVMTKRGNIEGDAVLRAADTMASIYLALPAFVLGAVGLAGGAALTAIERLKAER